MLWQDIVDNNTNMKGIRKHTDERKGIEYV